MWLELVMMLAEAMDEAWDRFITPVRGVGVSVHSWWSGLSFVWLQEYRSHHYLSAAAIIFFFWPVFATLIMALTVASTWVFWLATSVFFGILQLIYVTYQFLMITVDIMGLSALKTYSTTRTTLLYYLDKSGLKERKSRRRWWHSKLNEANSYFDYSKIPLEAKDVVSRSLSRQNSSVTEQRRGRAAASNDGVAGQTRQRSTTPPPRPESPSSPNNNNKPFLGRSSSFGDADKADRSPLWLTRNKSFSHGASQTDQSSSLLLEPEETLQLQEELGMTGPMLLTTTNRLREARISSSKDRSEQSMSSLQYLLSGVVKRNHLGLDDLLTQDARSVAESGRHGLSDNALQVIQDYYAEVEACLAYLADAPLCSDPSRSPPSGAAASSSLLREDSSATRQAEIHDRITQVRKMKQNMGRTALMLSGGGAQAMYHLGTVKALIDAGLWDNIKVISGTSGGSISAAMCAIRNKDELRRDVCVSTVSTDFLLTGEQKKQNVRWFPSVMEMGAYWLKHKLLVDSVDFKRCCDFYYGDITFEEAFERTGKHVCITVSASRATGGSAQRLLLNHISTPHVTLSSAVAASCALPGVMAPAKLMTKDSHGNQEPFEVDGVEWIDGSVQADLPFQRISTLFNVSNYVVCQTNFHVIPFLNKAHHPSVQSFYWRLFQIIEWDIRQRALNLSRLGLFPRIFGQDISKVFQQKYHGNLTLVPRFTAMQTFGLKALANPSVSDMEGYLKFGQMAAWPYAL
jgi:predicted acylesterase/phospholipase RssA